MKVKWVCNECSSTNICEKSDHMTCFVCGNVHTRELLAGPDASSLDRRSVFSNWVRRIKSFFVSLVKAPEHRKPVEWTITRSPTDSREAYVEANPVYPELHEEHPELPEPAVCSSESRGIWVERTPTTEESTPWPEDRGRFNWDKLRTSGFMKVECIELRGVRAYRLTDRSGQQRTLPPTTMRAMGFIIE